MFGANTAVRVVQPTRAHDHVYDPVYTTSSQAVHHREAHAARMSTVERVPVHDNMFSDMHRYPRHLYRLAQPKPHAEIPVLPQEGVTRAPPPGDVLAASRLKFFKRPVVPFLQSIPAEILLGNPSNPRAAREVPADKAVEEAHQPKSKTVGVQTQYRESSTQTDPYTRDYMTAEGQEDPEILTIAHLTYGHGLPASLEEIKLIHRMREKAEFEKNLPSITDEAQFELRKKLLEERELKEWAEREEESKKEQEQKLQILIDTLRARENKAAVLAEARIDAVRQRKLNQRDRTFAEIHQQRIKVHRGLAKAREKVEAKPRKRDIVGEHADYASRVYAPMTREGRLPVQNQVVDYGIPLINNYPGLDALEKNLPKSLRLAEIGTSERKKKKKKLPYQKMPEYKTRAEKILGDLKYCDDLLGSKEEKEEKTIENIYRKFEPISRAPVPFVTPPENEEPNRAILLLQRLLRGRAVQNSYYQGKEHNIHLIKELRLAENPPAEVPEDPEFAIDVAFDMLCGDISSHALDYLSKDTVRVAQEEKIKVLVEVANQTRRIREAEESGRRQAEDLLRKKREEHYKALSEESSRAAGRYLDELFDGAVDKVSHLNAQHQASVKDTYLEKLVGDLEDNNNTAPIKVQDLVSAWLFPEVERRREGLQEEIQDRRFLSSAHSTAVDIVGAVILTRDPGYKAASQS